MRNIRVIARSPDGTTLGLAAMQDNMVSIYPHSYSGPFILELRTDGSGTGAYYDEALQAWTLLGPTQALHVMVPSLTHHLSFNALSEAAYQWALTQYGSEANFTAANMAAANAAVASAVNRILPSAYAIADITEYAAAVSDTTAPNSLPNTHAGRFATVLAAQALAAQAYNNSQPNPIAGFNPALAFMKEITQDYIRNQSIGNTAAVAGGTAYDNITLPSLLTQALWTARNQYADPTQPTVAPPTRCFNPALLTSGTNELLSYDDGSSINLTVGNTQAFNGNANTIPVAIAATVPASGGAPGSTNTSYNYYGADTSNGLLSYGSSATNTSGGTTFASTIVNTPPVLNQQFLLLPGASASYTTTMTDTLSINGVAQSPASTTLQVTTTFNGFGTVTVPAGTYTDACQFTQTTTATAAGSSTSATSTNVFWVAPSGFSVLLKSTTTANGTTTTAQLTSGTLNGAPIH